MRDILQGLCPDQNLRISSAGRDCLVDAAATYGCEYMVRGIMAAGHAKRKTLMLPDVRPYKRLQDAGASQSVLAVPKGGW